MSKQIVGKGTIQIEFDYDSALKKALSDIEKQWQKVNIVSLEEIQAIKKALDEEKKKTQEKLKQQRISDSLKAQQIKLTEEIRKANAYNKEYVSYATSLLNKNKLMTREEKAKLQVLKNQAKERETIAKKLSQQKEGLDETKKTLDDINIGLVAMLYNLDRIGQAMYNIVTESVKLQASIEKSLTISATIAGASPEQYEKMSKAVNDLGAITPIQLDKIADSMYKLASAGLEAEEIIQALPSATKLSVGVGEDLERVISALVSTIRGFNKDFSESKQILDVFASSVANSQATIEKLQVSFARLAPIAEQSNVKFEELTALLSRLYDTGLSGSRAGTVLVNVLTRLNSFTDKSKASLEKAGLTVYDVSLQYNSLAESLAKITKAMQENRLQSDDLQQIFGVRGKLITTITDTILKQTKAIEGATVSVKDLIVAYDELVDKYSDTTGASDKFFSAQEKTTQMIIDRYTNAIDRLKRNVGEANKEVFKPFAKTITTLVNDINKLAEASKTFSAFLSTVSAGSAIFGKLLSIVSQISIALLAINSAGGFTALARSISTATTAVGAFVVANAPLITTIGAVVAGLTALIHLYNKEREVRRITEAQREYNETISELVHLLSVSESKKLRDISLTEKQKKAIEELEKKTGVYIQTLEDLNAAKILEKSLIDKEAKEKEIKNLENKINDIERKLKKADDSILNLFGVGKGRAYEALKSDLEIYKEQLKRAKDSLIATNNDISSLKDFFKSKTSNEGNKSVLDITALVDNYAEKIFNGYKSNFDREYNRKYVQLLEEFNSKAITSDVFIKKKSVLEKQKETEFNKQFLGDISKILEKSSEEYFGQIKSVIKEKGGTEEQVQEAFDLFTTKVASFLDVDINLDKEKRDISSKIENVGNIFISIIDKYFNQLKYVQDLAENVQNAKKLGIKPSDSVLTELKNALRSIGFKNEGGTIDEIIDSISNGADIKKILFENAGLINENFNKFLDIQTKNLFDNIKKVEEEISTMQNAGFFTEEDVEAFIKSSENVKNVFLKKRIKLITELNKILSDYVENSEEEIDVEKEKAKLRKELYNNNLQIVNNFKSQVNDIEKYLSLYKDSDIESALSPLRNTLELLGVETLDIDFVNKSKKEINEQIQKLLKDRFEAISQEIKSSKSETIDGKAYDIKLTEEELLEIEKSKVDTQVEILKLFENLTEEVKWKYEQLSRDLSALGLNLSQIGSLTENRMLSGLGGATSAISSGLSSWGNRTGGMFASLSNFTAGLGVIGAGISLFSSLSSMIGGKSVDELQVESDQQWEEQNQILENIQTTLESNLNGLLELSKQMVDNTKPTVSNLQEKSNQLNTLADYVFNQDRDFGSLSMRYTRRESNGLFKSKDVKKTITRNLQDVVNHIYGESSKTIQEMSLQELEDLSSKMKKLTEEDLQSITNTYYKINSSNLDDLINNIDKYIELITKARQEAKEFAKIATLSDFEGMTAQSVNSVYKELKKAYEDAGIEITDDVESYLQILAEEQSIQETMTDQVRDGFVSGLLEGNNASKSIINSMGDYFSGMLTNVSKVFYDTILDGFDTKISDFYKQYSKDLQKLKSENGDVLEFAKNYDYSSVLQTMIEAQNLSQSIDSVTSAIREQAEALGIDMETIDILLGDNDNLELRDNIKNAVTNGIKDGFNNGEITKEDIANSIVGEVIDTTLSEMISTILEDSKIKDSINQIIKDANSNNLNAQEENINSLVDLIMEQVDSLSDEIDMLNNLKEEFYGASENPIVFFDENNLETIQKTLEDSKNFSLTTKGLESDMVTTRILKVEVSGDDNISDETIKKIVEEIRTFADEVSTSRFI